MNKSKVIEKVITIPKELIRDDLVVIQRENLEKLNKENLELKKAIQAILVGEMALRKGKARSFRQFLKSKHPDYAKNL